MATKLNVETVLLTTSALHPDVFLNANLSVEDLTLTKSGAFYRKFVKWAAEDFQWRGFEPPVLYSVNKVLNEPDFPPLFLLHEVLLSARLMRHLKGKAVLTKAGKAILGHHGPLQVVIAARLLAEPYLNDVPPEAMPIFWNMRHMLGVIGNRLGDWVTTGDLAEWILPVDLFPAAGPFGPRYEAAFFIASNLLRPLNWLGLLEEADRDFYATRMDERLIRKSPLFNQFIRVLAPSAGSISVH